MLPVVAYSRIKAAAFGVIAPFARMGEEKDGPR
jgi:hypothetical protein